MHTHTDIYIYIYLLFFTPKKKAIHSEEAKLYSVEIKADFHSFTQSINKRLLRTHNMQGTAWNSFGE